MKYEGAKDTFLSLSVVAGSGLHFMYQAKCFKRVQGCSQQRSSGRMDCKTPRNILFSTVVCTTVTLAFTLHSQFISPSSRWKLHIVLWICGSTFLSAFCRVCPENVIWPMNVHLLMQYTNIDATRTPNSSVHYEVRRSTFKHWCAYKVWRPFLWLREHEATPSAMMSLSALQLEN